MFVCQVCGDGVGNVQTAIVRGWLVVHKACLIDPSAALTPLTGGDRARLIRACFQHSVATCGECDRDYLITELGRDLLGRRHNLCPFCRSDLTASIRLHIAACAVVRVTDPEWQAEAKETLARARELRKATEQLGTRNELARIESEITRARARQTRRRSDPSTAK